MGNVGKFKVGTRFIGNENNTEMEVVSIESKTYRTTSGKLRKRINPTVMIKVLRTGELASYELKMLERFNLKIIKY